MIVTGMYSLESWTFEWNEQFQHVYVEHPVYESGELPLVKKAGDFAIGIHEFGPAYTTHDFIISPQHGVQFRDDLHGGKLMEAIRIQIVD